METLSFPGESSFSHPKTKAKHKGGGGVAIITKTKWAKIRWGIGIHLKLTMEIVLQCKNNKAKEKDIGYK